MCKKWGIACIDFPQHLHEQGPLFDYIKSAINPFDWLDQKNGSVRHCQIARYAVENFAINHNDIVGLIDGDMFLIRDFSIREYIKNYVLIASRQTDYYQKGFEYAWLALCFFTPYTLK